METPHVVQDTLWEVERKSIPERVCGLRGGMVAAYIGTNKSYPCTLVFADTLSYLLNEQIVIKRRFRCEGNSRTPVLQGCGVLVGKERQGC